MAGAAKHEDKPSYFVFKFILLSIFYSLSLYHSTNVIMLLDSFSHVAEMLSPLMLQLELQNMKISYYYLQIYIIKYILFIIVLPPDASNFNIIPGHTFFGHEPSLDTYSFLDMNYHWTYIIWT